MLNVKSILEARGYQVTERSDTVVMADTGVSFTRSWVMGTKGGVVVKHFYSPNGQEHVQVEWEDCIAEGCVGVPDEMDYPMFTATQLCELLDTGVIVGHDLYSSWED